MTAPWPVVSLGELIRLERRPVDVLLDCQYQEIGTYSYGRGIFHKRPRSGLEVGDKDLFLIKEGDLILQVTFAWEGAIALCSEAEDGLYGSIRYPTFRVDEARCFAPFLAKYLCTEDGLAQIGRICPGSAGRNRVLAIKRLPEIMIPLPPIEEQRRIVTRIDELAAKVEEARHVRAQSAESMERLSSSVLRLACIGELTAAWRSEHKNVEPACDLLDRISRSAWDGHRKARDRSPMVLPAPPEVPKTWSVTEIGALQEAGLILDIQDGNHGNEYPRKAEFVSDGIPFVTAKQIYPEGVDISGAPRLSREKASRLRIGFARGGDVLLTHNASVGDVALAPDDAGDFVVGTSVTYWRCNPAGLNPRYAYYFLKSPFFQDQLAFIMKQTTRNQVSVLKQVNLWMCVPPIEEQAEIVRRIDSLVRSARIFTDLQAQTAAELDAMLPAILDKAFKGEL